LKKKVFSFIKYLLLFSVGLLFLYLAFRGNDPRELLNALKNADYGWIAISMLCGVIAHLSRAIRWNILLEPLGHKPLLQNTFAAVMAGYLANMAVPRMGEVTRCGALSEKEKIPFEQLLGTVIAERVMDLFTLIFCIVLTAVLEFELLGDFIARQLLYPLGQKFSMLFYSSAMSVTVLLLTLVVIAAGYYLLRKYRNNALFHKVSTLIKGVFNGLRSVTRLRRKAAFIFHSFLIWFMYFLTSYFCFFALDSTADLGADAALFALVAGSIGMTAPVQGGMGIYHILVSQGLTLFGIALAQGVIFATVVHTSQLLLTLVLGSLGLLLLYVNKTRRA
jgi:glycosyltransferase 2 family protein